VGSGRKPLDLYCKDRHIEKAQQIQGKFAEEKIHSIIVEIWT